MFKDFSYEYNGIRWTPEDCTRFLKFCVVGPVPPKHTTPCILWGGAKSRGRGNTVWYGSFYTKKKVIRAHKFYALAFLGLRPVRHEHHLDHTCQNSLCISHIQLIPEIENLKLRWSRAAPEIEDDGGPW